MEDTHNFSSDLWRPPLDFDLTLHASNANTQAIPCGAHNPSWFFVQVLWKQTTVAEI